MRLIISDAAVHAVQFVPESAHGTLMLGAITEAGEVHLATADGTRIRDHRSWLESSAVGPIVGGFALLVRSGRIVRVFRSSEFNRTSDALLPMEWTMQLVKGLPSAPDAIIYGT